MGPSFPRLSQKLNPFIKSVFLLLSKKKLNRLVESVFFQETFPIPSSSWRQKKYQVNSFPASFFSNSKSVSNVASNRPHNVTKIGLWHLTEVEPCSLYFGFCQLTKTELYTLYFGSVELTGLYRATHPIFIADLKLPPSE